MVQTEGDTQSEMSRKICTEECDEYVMYSRMNVVIQSLATSALSVRGGGEKVLGMRKLPMMIGDGMIEHPQTVGWPRVL